VKRTLAALSAAVLGTIGALSLIGTAHAEALCKTGSVLITDRVDSGTAGNWAKDTFTRKFEVCHAITNAPKKDVVVPGWFYSIKLWDNGQFVTTGTTSPMGHTMLDGVKGEFSGALDKTGLSVNGVFEAPANWQGWTEPTNTNKLDTTSWIKALFTNGDTSTVGGLKFEWAWIYKLCNEYWLNADEQHDGNKGDITGTARIGCVAPPKFTDKCDGSTVVTLANLATSELAKVTYTVNGDVVVVNGGQTVNKTVKVDGEFTVTYQVYGGKLRKFVMATVKHTWTQPKGCTSPSPSTSTSTVVPVPSTSTAAPGGLPVTGPNTGLYAGGAAALLVAGGTLFFVARRRRVKFEA
jgi:hypothetical protein